jgi:hypothetical protein
MRRAMPATKTCSSCEVRLSLAKFGTNIRTPDGFSYYCKACAAAKQREWKEKNPEKVRAWQKRCVDRYKKQNRVKQ